ncbi:hypothetical protein P3W33_09140 [Luteibacter sp. PPL552]
MEKEFSVPFIPLNQIYELVNFAKIADKEARSDLFGGYIISENDYTSNFTGALRRIINSNSQTGLIAQSRLLSHQEEGVTGCDAAIVIQSLDEIKVLLIEAKWPRLSIPQYKWDEKQTSTGLSHFSNQLHRQAVFSSRYAIVEMFYSEHAFGMQPTWMQPNGSACVWHIDAIAYDQTRPTAPGVWTQSELTSLLAKGTHDIGAVLEEVCWCRQGRPISLPNDRPVVSMDIPLPNNVLFISADTIRE